MGALIVTASLLLAAAVGGQSVEAAAGEASERRLATRVLSDGEIIRRIDHYQAKTWHWQRVMGRRRSPTTHSARKVSSRDYRLWVLRFWQRRASRITRVARRPAHRSAWLCIHRYEGHWRSYPGAPGALGSGGPYYGGLQMDLQFQRTYGAYLLRTKGTANRWTPLEQMWVAERAHRTRGFYPWPNTARYCGLI